MCPRPWPRFSLAIALAVLAIAGCRGRSPDVIVVLVDTLRADHVGAFGGPPGLTPFLDSLAASGVVFRNAYSTSSFTAPAVASLFTSRFPSQHHVTRLESPLPDDEITLAETLAKASYRRVGFVGNFLLAAQLGYGQGFDAWFPSRVGPKARANQVTQEAIRFYDRQIAPRPWSRWTRRPLFLYLHLMEPHAPYEPPEAARGAWVPPPPAGVDEQVATDKLMNGSRWDELSADEVRYLAALYGAEVASLDASLARLFRRLRSRGLLDHAIVVVMADHGEEFRDHGSLQHGSSLYQEVVHIPLLVTGPGLPAGRVVTDPVSLIDVAPTLLDLLGLPAEAAFEGHSLRGRLVAGDAPDVVLELPQPSARTDFRRHSAGLVHHDLKVLERAPAQSEHGVEAYDLRADPRETRPNPPAIMQQAGALEARLAERRQTLASRAGAVPEAAPLDDAARARLRALGYAD